MIGAHTRKQMIMHYPYASAYMLTSHLPLQHYMFSMANINIHFCRGRYNVELHLSFLRLQGQANDFKIQYSSVVRLFLLPKVFFLGLIFKGAD